MIDPDRDLSVEVDSLEQMIIELKKVKGISSEEVNRRAQETAWRIVDVAALQCSITRKDNLSPNDSVESIVKEIVESKKNLMIVGHLPFLAKLASRLLSGQEKICTGVLRQWAHRRTW